VFTLLRTIDILFQIYTLMIFIRILVSWVPDLADKRWVQFVAYYTDPYLNIFRRVIPPIGMIDISPIFAFLALGLIEHFLKFLVVFFFK
jgi:YggT family protein